VLDAALKTSGFPTESVDVEKASGDVILTIDAPKHYQLDNAQYLIFDRNDIFVGALFVPLLAPTDG
jgi:hypothetical protein